LQLGFGVWLRNFHHKIMLWHVDPLLGNDIKAATEKMCFLCFPCPDVGNSPAGKNVSSEAKDIVGIRYQATTDEDRAEYVL
jgi:hypothetical protein